MNKFRSAILSGKGDAPVNPLVTDKTPRGSDKDHLTSVEVQRHETRSADHRDSDRHRLASEEAQARYRGKTHRVELINLSGGGAMIAASFTPYLWERVDLLLGDGAGIECAVRWVRHDRIGLEFAHETTIDCSAEERNALLIAIIEKNFPECGSFELGAPEAAPAPAKPSAIDAARRAEIRHPLIWTGKLYHAHDEHEVRLRNIGEHGALIDQIPFLKEGDTPLLDLGNGIQLLATVAWSRGGQAGLKFDKAFDLKRLASTSPKVAGGNWVPPTYLDTRADESDPWAQGWRRQSVEELRQSLEGFLKR